MNRARGIAQAAIAVAVLALSACSSGDDPAAETISLDRAALAYVLARGETQDPAPETVTATYSGTSILVDMAPGAFPLSTLDVVPTFSGPGVQSYDVHLFGISFTGPSGRYVTGLRFATARADGSGVAFVDLPMVFDVYDELVVNVIGGAQFDMGANAQETRDVQVYAHDIGWTVQADQGWIVLGATSGLGDAATTLGADTTGLSPGSYTGNVVFTRTDSAYTVTVPVSLNVQL